jgi:hypothetical protein
VISTEGDRRHTRTVIAANERDAKQTHREHYHSLHSQSSGRERQAPRVNSDTQIVAAKAPVPLHPGYRPGLDRDGDGIACE